MPRFVDRHLSTLGFSPGSTQSAHWMPGGYVLAVLGEKQAPFFAVQFVELLRVTESEPGFALVEGVVLGTNDPDATPGGLASRTTRPGGGWWFRYFHDWSSLEGRLPAELLSEIRYWEHGSFEAQQAVESGRVEQGGPPEEEVPASAEDLSWIPPIPGTEED